VAFEVPEGSLPVRMQVGEQSVTVVGWIAPESGTLPGLLRELATEIEEIEKERARTAGD
jgi:hypothetical protein